MLRMRNGASIAHARCYKIIVHGERAGDQNAAIKSARAAKLDAIACGQSVALAAAFGHFNTGAPCVGDIGAQPRQHLPVAGRDSGVSAMARSRIADEFDAVFDLLSDSR